MVHYIKDSMIIGMNYFNFDFLFNLMYNKYRKGKETMINELLYKYKV